MSDVVAKQRALKARLDTVVTVMEIRSRLGIPLTMGDLPEDLAAIIDNPKKHL